MEKMEQIKKKIAEDVEFAASLKAAKTPEEVLDKLIAAGYEVTEDDLKSLKVSDGEPISDDDLDNVAGGFFFIFF
ncbi:MAG: Nif11-like leader peptide family RiPP precursor [Anaerovoracaceae bacterium]